MNKINLIITPKTKVLELIESYPILEETLLSSVPAFKKLKNPILRRTVAKITTLQQASIVGNVNIEDLINLLRKKVGQDIIKIENGVEYMTEKPLWFNETKVVQELDVREMLAAGEHPVNQVLSDLKNISEDGIYKLIAPFLPAPLIDKAISIGMRHWVKKESDTLFFVYFNKNKKQEEKQ